MSSDVIWLQATGQKTNDELMEIAQEFQDTTEYDVIVSSDEIDTVSKNELAIMLENAIDKLQE